jgi:hypothetical protein
MSVFDLNEAVFAGRGVEDELAYIVGGVRIEFLRKVKWVPFFFRRLSRKRELRDE